MSNNKLTSKSWTITGRSINNLLSLHGLFIILIIISYILFRVYISSNNILTYFLFVPIISVYVYKYTDVAVIDIIHIIIILFTIFYMLIYYYLQTEYIKCFNQASYKYDIDAFTIFLVFISLVYISESKCNITKAILMLILISTVQALYS